MRSSASIGTDNPVERSQHEAESEENEGQEPSGESSFSSSDGSNKSHPNNVASVQAGPLLLQGQPAVFQSGATSMPDHSQQAVTVAVLANPSLAGAPGVHFPPTAVESFDQQDINQSLQPEQHMSLLRPNHPIFSSANGCFPSAPNFLFLGDHQKNVPSQIANHADLSPPSHLMGMESHGYLFPTSEVIQNFGINAYGAINPYHLPLSNLPPEFRLESSSSVQLPQIQQQDPRSILDKGDHGLIRPQPTNWRPKGQTTMHDPPTAAGTQEIRFQGLLNQNSSGVPSNIYAGTGSSSHAQVPNMPIPLPPQEMSPYVSGSPLIPLPVEGMSSGVSNNRRGTRGNFVNHSQAEAGKSSLRSPKRKMVGRGETNLPPSSGLQLGNWFSQGQNSHNPTGAQSSRPVPIRNKCYDPLYEEMGLPIDPHLRMFLARRDNGEFGDRFK